MIVLTAVLGALLLASVAANFGLFGRWRDSKAKLDEANRQLARSEQSVTDQQEQLAAARVLLMLMLAAWAALREECEQLRATIEQSERFGVALGKRYEDTKAELAVRDVNLQEREEEIKIFYSVVDTLSRTIAAERNTKAQINAIQDFIKRCQSLWHGLRSPA